MSTANGNVAGLTENDGHENDGPSKLQGMKLQDMKMPDMKMQDMKMMDKNDWRQGAKLQENKQSFNRDNCALCKFLNPKHRNTLHTVSYRRVLKSAN